MTRHSFGALGPSLLGIPPHRFNKRVRNIWLVPVASHHSLLSGDLQ